MIEDFQIEMKKLSIDRVSTFKSWMQECVIEVFKASQPDYLALINNLLYGEQPFDPHEIAISPGFSKFSLVSILTIQAGVTLFRDVKPEELFRFCESWEDDDMAEEFVKWKELYAEAAKSQNEILTGVS